MGSAEGIWLSTLGGKQTIHFQPMGVLMRVEPKDGACRSCGGVLEIIDADDATMSVACQECGDEYLVETDAFGDGCMTHYPGFLSAIQARRPS
jgi:hypothetical protein